MHKEIKEKPAMKDIPLHRSPELIKIMVIKRKFVDQMRRFSEKEFKELRHNPPLDATGNPIKNIRLIGRCSGEIIFDYCIDDDITNRKLARIGQVDLYRTYAQEDYEVHGITWPLDDAAKKKVEEIDQKWWDFAEKLPQLFEE